MLLKTQHLKVKDSEYYSILLCLAELYRHEAISVGVFDRLKWMRGFSVGLSFLSEVALPTVAVLLLFQLEASYRDA